MVCWKALHQVPRPKQPGSGSLVKRVHRPGVLKRHIKPLISSTKATASLTLRAWRCAGPAVFLCKLDSPFLWTDMIHTCCIIIPHIAMALATTCTCSVDVANSVCQGKSVRTVTSHLIDIVTPGSHAHLPQLASDLQLGPPGSVRLQAIACV